MLKRIICLTATLTAVVAVSSCTKSGNNLSPEGYSNQGTAVATGNAVLTPFEQKEKIENVGTEFFDEIDIENWQSSADFFRRLSDHLASLGNANYHAFDAFETWSEEMEDYLVDGKIKDAKLTYKVTAALSSLQNGTFTEKDGAFEFKESGSNLKVVTFLDGKTVTITLTHGAESKLYEVYSEHWEAEYDWEREYWQGEEFTEADYSSYVKIPSWVNIEVKEGSAKRLNWKVNIDFTDSDNNGKISVEKDKAVIDTQIDSDGYSLYARESYWYEKGLGCSTVNTSIHKGSKLLLAAAAEGSASMTGSMDEGYELGTPKTVKGAIDVLGELQAKGTVDYAQALYLMEKLDPYASQDDFNSAVAAIEKCLDVAIYYDKKQGRQAWLGLEPMYDEYYNQRYVEPVIRFSDGTSYGVDEFFNENDFRNLLKAMEAWENGIAEYFGYMGY